MERKEERPTEYNEVGHILTEDEPGNLFIIKSPDRAAVVCRLRTGNYSMMPGIWRDDCERFRVGGESGYFDDATKARAAGIRWVKEGVIE